MATATTSTLKTAPLDKPMLLLERLPTIQTELEGVERRSDPRSAFPYRMLLEPLDGDPAEHRQTIQVLGVNISATGFCFSYDEPLPYRRVSLIAADARLAEFGMAGLNFELVIRWRRFVAQGCYEIGGRIVWPQSDEV